MEAGKKIRTAPGAVLLLGGLMVSLGFAASQRIPSGMKFIPGGSFLMGAASTVVPVHSVTISPFYMDSTPVTQRRYLALMQANPSHFTGDGNRPVETVSWFDAALYCNARSRSEGRDTVYVYGSMRRTPGNGCDTLGGLRIRYDRNGYRLPTEAEYEYAERADAATEYFWGDSINGDYCWYYANAESATHPVARKRPNAFGLYDMAGNLWEWCDDWYGPYAPGAQTDPVGPADGLYRVLRGGSWYVYYLRTLDSGFRFYLPPAPEFKPPRDYYGFRCVLAAHAAGMR